MRTKWIAASPFTSCCNNEGGTGHLNQNSLNNKRSCKTEIEEHMREGRVRMFTFNMTVKDTFNTRFMVEITNCEEYESKNWYGERTGVGVYCALVFQEECCNMQGK